MAQYKLSGNATKIYNVFTSHFEDVTKVSGTHNSFSGQEETNNFSSTQIKDTILLVQLF